MAADILKQAEPYIREVIRICGVLNIDGKELDQFNELVRRASKLIYMITIYFRDALKSWQSIANF